jgi:hypothetical protein
MRQEANRRIVEEIKELERELHRKRSELAARRTEGTGDAEADARARRWRDLAERIGAVSPGGDAVDDARAGRRA